MPRKKKTKENSDELENLSPEDVLVDESFYKGNENLLTGNNNLNGLLL